MYEYLFGIMLAIKPISCPTKLTAERSVHLEGVDHVGDGTGGGGDGDNEAADAERLKADPLCAASRHSALLDVHLDGEVDGERPEGDGAQEPDNVAEEGEEHGDNGGDAHERRSPRQAEEAEREGTDAELAGDEGAVRPGRGGAALHEGEDGLAEHLVARFSLSEIKICWRSWINRISKIYRKYQTKFENVTCFKNLVEFDLKLFLSY